MKQKIYYVLKIFFISTLPAFLLFTVLFFPFSDLSDLVTTQVYKMTGNQVYLEFKELGLNVVPTPGVSLEKVKLETPILQNIKLNSLNIRPSILGLISLKPGVSISGDGFFGGDISLSTKGGDKNEKGELKQQINLELDSIQLQEIASQFKLPVGLEGKASLELGAQIDPIMKEQPEGDIELTAKPFKIKGGNINTGMMGDIVLPAINLSQASLIGNFKQGKLKIKKIVLGKDSDEVQIKIDGDFSLRVTPFGGRSPISPGPYALNLNISASQEFQQKFGLYLTFIEHFKKNSGNRTLYNFKLSASGVKMPPKMEAL